MTTCTRCGGCGFLNVHQIEDIRIHEGGVEAIKKWAACNENHDVCVCDCCGDGEDWYGEPGQHYTTRDPRGREGPYTYNGGLCECN